MNSIRIQNDKDCCGCRACENICPKKAITMQENKEGFLYPHIDEKKCIDCGMCKKVCPLLNRIDRTEYLKEPICYAAKSLNKEVQINSSSGGIFGLLAKKILANNGIVVGCEIDSNFKVKHIIVDQEKDLIRIMGSKYVFSDLTNLFPIIKKELDNKTQVLFSGVPCQISALLTYLGKKYDNLITVEVICHGVPSQKLFNKYTDYLQKKYKGKLLDYKFRSKKAASWGTFKALATFKCLNGKTKIKRINADFDPYYWSFLYCKNYRESCYKCNFANPKRNADITLGDFWGIEKILPQMVDYNGVSNIVVNTEKGEKMLQDVGKLLELKRVNYDIICDNNGQLKKPSERPTEREEWYKNIDEDDFIKNIKIKKNLRSYVKIFFPQKLKFKIKKIIKRK